MSNVLRNEREYPMIPIPAGRVDLRNDRIKKTWSVELEAFLLAPVPVTNALYASSRQKPLGPDAQPQAPAVEVSWLEAVLFCNWLSKQEGLQECYAVDADGERVVWNRDVNGYRLPTEAEWQYACKSETNGYRYGELDDIAWYQENSSGTAHAVGQKQPICWATSGSGVGTSTMRKSTVPTASFAAEVGRKRNEAAARHAAVAAIRHFGSMTSAFVWPDRYEYKATCNRVK